MTNFFGRFFLISGPTDSSCLLCVVTSGMKAEVKVTDIVVLFHFYLKKIEMWEISVKDNN